MTSRTLAGRARQAWTIAAIELRRVFIARRSLWVYVLALLPSVIFFGHAVDMKLDIQRLSRRGLTAPALIDSENSSCRSDGQTVSASLSRRSATSY